MFRIHTKVIQFLMLFDMTELFEICVLYFVERVTKKKPF